MIALSIALNVYSFYSESNSALERELELKTHGISFGPGSYSWGFPFKMYSYHIGHLNNIGFELVPTALNIGLTISSGLALGLIWHFIFSRRQTNALNE